MPVTIIPISDQNPAQAVAQTIAALEADGALNCNVSQVGDQFLITYDMKPKIGRPAKETR